MPGGADGPGELGVGGGQGSLAGPSPRTVANTAEIWRKPHSPALTGPHVSAREPTGRHGQASPGKVTYSLPFSSSLGPRKARTSPTPFQGPSCPTGPEGFTKTLPPPPAPHLQVRGMTAITFPPPPHLRQRRGEGPASGCTRHFSQGTGASDVAPLIRPQKRRDRPPAPVRDPSREAVPPSLHEQIQKKH